MQVDVTNFDKVYPQAVEQIKNCTFIALDLEFSGLFYNANCMPSLFDSLEDRYKKLRANVSHFIPLQLGLSMFTRSETKNEYTAVTYSFFCCPRSHGPQVACFTMEVAATEFLSDNAFDFNRFARNGIPFLNEPQEKTFRSYMANKSKIAVNHSMMDKLAEYRSRITEWSARLPMKDGRKQGQNRFHYEHFINPLHDYLVIDHLRQDFKSFWITLGKNEISVRSVSPFDRKKLLADSVTEEEEIMNTCIGLSRLVKEVIYSKKPIVGNNMMTDMVMLYQHYIDVLPGSLQTFKEKLLKNFNTIYDIKAMISNIRKYFPAYEDDLNARSLDDLYAKLSSPTFSKGKNSYFQPVILRNDNEEYEIVNRCHDAGSDAYATGYVFLRVCAMVATTYAEERTKKASTSWESFIEPMACLKNKINLIRAAFHYIDLEAKSQVSVRPQWLVLRCRNSSDSVSLAQVHSMLATHSASIDFRPISTSEIMLAIGNFKSVREIMEKFRNDKNYKITQYNAFRDSKYGRLLLWSTILFGSGASGYFAFKLFNR